MSHLNGEVLTIQRLHLVQSISLELLGLDPHCHLQHAESKGGVSNQLKSLELNLNDRFTFFQMFLKAIFLCLYVH